MNLGVIQYESGRLVFKFFQRNPGDLTQPGVKGGYIGMVHLSDKLNEADSFDYGMPNKMSH
jgi:hypothetical protein